MVQPLPSEGESSMPIHRRTLTHGLALAAAGIWAPAYGQSRYPRAPIRIVIPTAVGGGYDSMMRVIGQKLTEAWGQPIIVEAKPGASGAIAAASEAKAAPDGYTLMLAYSAFLSNLELMPSPGYKLADFAPVSLVVLAPLAVGVRSSLGVNSLRDYIIMAKSNPGKLSYGSYGQGSGGHFLGELLNVAAGMEVVHVPYKGEAPMLTDLLGSQIQAGIASVGGMSKYPGKIVPLAVSSTMRSPAYPNLPTFAELGQPAVDMPGWGALFAPSGTPKAVIDRLALEIARIVKLPDVAPKIQDLGFDPMGSGPAQLVSFLKVQQAKVHQLVAAGRVKL
jgi:tripartite-type tricarboxylate transporter receptor subunit TctC